MKRLKQIECNAVEILQKTREESLSFNDILAKIDIDGTEIIGGELYKCLRKLAKNNFISIKKTLGGAYFFISEDNKKLNIRKVRCPKCRTVKRVHIENQMATHCLNKNCTQPSGRHRIFWLVNIDHWSRGLTRKINIA